MLFVADGVALAARCVFAAPLSGVGAVDDPVCVEVHAVRSIAVRASREIGLITGSWVGRGAESRKKRAGSRKQET
jgi:hypothetical protein